MPFFKRVVCHFFETLFLCSQFLISNADSSKQRTRLRSKITAEKAKLTSRVQKYNEEIHCASDEHPSTSTESTLSEIMKGNFPWGNNEGESIVMS